MEAIGKSRDSANALNDAAIHRSRRCLKPAAFQLPIGK